MYKQNRQTQSTELEVKPLSALRPAFTLVELLAVVTIMVILIAVSIPMMKPLLESRRTANGAQVLAGALQRVRAKAIQEQTSYGLRLIPYSNTNVSVQFRLQKNKRRYVNTDSRVRVIVESGKVLPVVFEDGKWTKTPNDPGFAALLNTASGVIVASSGCEIQFNRAGRYYKLGTNQQLEQPYLQLNLPEAFDGTSALEFSISQPPRSAMAPQVVMPRGTVVDLLFSGTMESQNGNVLFFSPTGGVDTLNNTMVNEPIYFCVGEWDRQITDTSTMQSLAEDKKNNLEMPATYWVVVHPKTGLIRITENAPVTNNNDLTGARKYAAEVFTNIGGF
jgi:prepilin-type N-terminal cleavage/methylation domain-containing protein